MMRHDGFDDEPTFEKFERNRKKVEFSGRMDRLKIKRSMAIQASRDHDCNKIAYESKQAAERSRRRLNSTGSNGQKELQYAYRCDKCGNFHLTSAISSRKSDSDRQLLSLWPRPMPAQAQIQPVAAIERLGARDPNPVLRAVLNNNIDGLNRLIEEGHTVNVISHHNRSTPLIAAVALGLKEICDVLIGAGALVNHQNKKGSTALHTAADQGKREIADALLAAGADLNILDRAGKTAVQRADPVSHHELHTHLAAIYERVKRPPAPALTPVEARALYAEWVKVEGSKDAPGCWTPLHHAARSGNTQRVRELLALSETNAAKRNLASRTAFHLAVFHGHLDSVVAMACADRRVLEINDNHKRSPLFIACESGHLSIVEFLVAMGATMQTRTIYKTTPLHAAAKGGYVAIYRLLLSKGADPVAVDWKGQTPADLAAAHPNFQKT